MGKGPSIPEILLGLAQISASEGATATANRRLTIEEETSRRIEKRAADQIQEDKDEKIARKASGAVGFGNLQKGLEAQLRQGLITYADAMSQLRDRGAQYELDPEEAVNNLTNIYTKELYPGQLTTGTAAAYREFYGRDPTEKEKKDTSDLFAGKYYNSIQDLKDSLAKSPEYQDKFQTSYLGNYYDTMYGKEERDTEGKRTGKRAFKADSSLLPKYAAGTEGKAGVSIPTFNDESLDIAGIENREQSIRDTRKYLYSAGLTNLQGDIDKETQKLKNEGARDLAVIGQAGDKYKLMSLAFS